jgi:hypothetical protein
MVEGELDATLMRRRYGRALKEKQASPQLTPGDTDRLRE